jgi:hypothetical protein
MLTDLRFIIGAFFGFSGVTLSAYGLWGPSDVVEGIHVNIDSGVAMLVFGALMIATAAFTQQKASREQSPSSSRAPRSRD